MAKYSVNSNTVQNTETCEICGKKSDNKTVIKSVKLDDVSVSACSECRYEKNLIIDEKTDEDKQKKEKTSNKKTGYTISNPDSSWVEKSRPNYGNTETPYLVRNYSKIFSEKISKSGNTIEELSKELNISEDKLQAIENNNAIKQNISKSIFEKIEKELNIELLEK